MIKKILIFTTLEGHLSIAQSCQEILQKAGFQIRVSDPASLSKNIGIYLPFYRYFPFLFKIPYKLGEQETFSKTISLLVGKWLEKKVKNEIKIHQPDLIISTNLWYNPAISKFLDYQKTAIPFINVLTNPWNIHPLEISFSANLNLFYDKRAANLGRKIKLPEEKFFTTGWFVRKGFYQTYNKDNIRKSLGFKKNIFTLLICGGSEGTNMILKIVPALITIQKPIQIIVICGTNKRLFNTLNSFKKFMPRLARNNLLKNRITNLNLKIYQFTDELPQLIAVSDLVAGKAGPNLLFEAVAQKKPFLAICHIAGQEDDNLEIIKKKNLGLVEENPWRVVKLLKKIINQPSTLQRFTTSLIKERQYNLQSNQLLIKTVKTLI